VTNKGESPYEMMIAGKPFKVRLIQVGSGRMVAKVELLEGNPRDLRMVARELVGRILKDWQPDFVVTPCYRGLVLGSQVAEELDVPLVVLRENESIDLSEDSLVIRINHPLSGGERVLILDGGWRPQMEGKKVLLFDDAVYTGRTMEAANLLLNEVGVGEVRSVAVVVHGQASYSFELENLVFSPRLKSR